MKQVKIWGSAIVVAAALAAFASPASATTATSSAGITFTIEASAEGHVVIDNPIAKIECASTLQGTLNTHGSGVTANVVLGTLTFGSPVGTCTNDWHVTVVSAGWLEFHSIGNGDATVTSTGITIEATRFGINCRYATSSTDIGTITDGQNATIDLTAALPSHGGSFHCGTGATTWTGSYTVTKPVPLVIDNN